MSSWHDHGRQKWASAKHRSTCGVMLCTQWRMFFFNGISMTEMTVDPQNAVKSKRFPNSGPVMYSITTSIIIMFGSCSPFYRSRTTRKLSSWPGGQMYCAAALPDLSIWGGQMWEHSKQNPTCVGRREAWYPKMPGVVFSCGYITLFDLDFWFLMNGNQRIGLKVHQTPTTESVLGDMAVCSNKYICSQGRLRKARIFFFKTALWMSWAEFS